MKRFWPFLALFLVLVLLPLVVFLTKQRQEIRGRAQEVQAVACDGNNDQDKISNAINALPQPSGGTVTLPGRQCNLSSSINISKDNVTLQGQGSSTILFLNDNANTNVISATNKNNLHIKNLKINGNKAHQTPQDHIGLGIKLEGINRGIVENVEIYDTSWHGMVFYTPATPVNPEIVIRNVRVQDSGIRRTGGSGVGIVIGDAPQNITIEDNTIVNALQAGILITINGEARNIRIQRNSVQNPQGNGIWVTCNNRIATLDTLWVINNTVSGMHDTANPFGFWLMSGPEPGNIPCDNAQKYIQNNKVLPNGPGITGPYGDHFGLRGNNGVLTGNYSQGSHADGYAFGNFSLTLSNWTIRDNQAVNNPAQGFMIYRMRNSTITNNTASGNSQDGVRLNAGWDNIVEDNKVYNNDWRGIALDDTHGTDPLREASLRNTLRGNQVHDNSRVGIQETGNGDYNTLICNNVYGNAGGQIITVGPNTRILPCVSPTPTPTPRPTPRPSLTPTPTPTPTPTIPSPPPPTEEYGDNVIDIKDYNAFLSCFGKTVAQVPGCEAADLNDDGQVDSSDFVLLFDSFQAQYGD